jgi:hypothetical protein
MAMQLKGPGSHLTQKYNTDKWEYFSLTGSEAIKLCFHSLLLLILYLLITVCEAGRQVQNIYIGPIHIYRRALQQAAHIQTGDWPKPLRWFLLV